MKPTANETAPPHRLRFFAVWAAIALAVLVPLGLSALSPFLQWRSAAYIAASFAGVLALGLLLIQPLLMGTSLPGISALQRRGAHRWTGVLLVLLVFVHVGGLWLSNPPDTVDALLLASPTPFSVWGVVAMWAAFAAALFALLRRPLKLRPRTWRVGHTALAVIVVIGTIVHALLIVGTMEFYSKVGLSVLVSLATAKVIYDLWRWLQRGRARPS